MDLTTLLNDILTNSSTLSVNCLQISQEIQSGRFSLVELVENLGHLLINTASDKRQLGLTIFTKVLENLPKNFLNSQQLQFICSFYIDRLKDIHVITQILDGLITILQIYNLPDGIPNKILNELFHNVACQQQPQNDRYLIYNIFKLLFHKHPQELSAMGLDLVYGIMTSIENERDPRNLLYLFKFMPTFLQNTPLGHLSEEMFEVFACYFPIDFRTPPKDTPDIITRDDLAEELSNCLTAIPEFEEFCMSLAFEKLDSSLEIAIIDSLNLISTGCKTFPTSTYIKNSQQIWPKLVEILIKTSDKFVEEVCLKTFQNFIIKISKTDDLNTILKDIMDSLKGNLIQQSQQFQISYNIFICLSQSSLEACKFLIKDLIPTIINLYNISTKDDHKNQLVQLLIELLVAFLQQNHDHNDISNEAIKFILNLLQNSRELDVIFNGITKLTPYLTKEMRLVVYNTLKINIPDTENVLICLKSMGKLYSEEINDLLQSLMEYNENNLKFVVKTYCELIDIEYFTLITIELLIKGVENHSDLNKFAIYVYNLKEVIIKFSEKNNEIINNSILKHDLIRILINFTNNNKETLLLLNNIHVIIRNFIGYQSENVQTCILENNYDVIRQFLLNDYELSSLILLDGLISRLSPNISIENWDKIVIKLLEICLLHDNNLANELLANLINKHLNDENLTNFLQYSREICLKDFKNNTENIVNILCWITKALYMRNYMNAKDWSDLILQQLDEFEETSTGLGLILKPSTESLNEESKCNISLFYRQKLFTIATNYLSNNYTAEKTNYLCAIGCLLEFCPQQIIILQFPKIFKLVLNCLDYCKNSQTLYIILTILRQLLETNEKLLEEHLDEFLTRILNLTDFNDNMKVRVEALKCLQRFTQVFPFYKLIQHKPIIIKKLAKCLDDKKRIVRKEAVQARSMWYLLDAPQ